MNIEELKRCKDDFVYFSEKYVKVPPNNTAFKLFDYQKRLLKEYEEGGYIIFPKFRSGGFSTLAWVYALWRCMFYDNQSIGILFNSYDESVRVGRSISNIIQTLPDWLYPNLSSHRYVEKKFRTTNSSLHTICPRVSSSRAFTHLFIDEAAYIHGMEECWQAIYPTVTTAELVVVQSTIRGLDNWFQATLDIAREGKSGFRVFECSYREHPKAAEMETWKEKLGMKRYLQEVECVVAIDSSEIPLEKTLEERLMDITRNHKLSKMECYAILEAVSKLRNALDT